VLRAGFGPDVVITGGQGLHDVYVAEHALALILAAVRRIPTMVRAQDQRRWPTELGGRAQQQQTEKSFTLHGANITVWGFGGIAQRLTPYLTTLGAQVTGVARSAGTRSGTYVVSVEEIDRQLPATDVLVMILPSNESTRHALSAELLRLLPPHAFVVNVGRGDTVDEEALAAELASGAIAGAALDVFDQEPLPVTSPLWALPNVIISPHAAGGRPLGAAELVSRNLIALVEGRPLENVTFRQGVH
jgi:phosphoglycerate dehydrogenase-like enzyme